MTDYYENFLVYDGSYFAVYFHAEAHDFSSVNEYYKSCQNITRASLLFLVKRIADTGRIFDERKFRYEDKKNKIYCFKPRDERFLCFFLKDKRIIITSGYTKKGQKLDRNELAKAVKIRNEYFD
mgnify:CR=1 FL=1